MSGRGSRFVSKGYELPKPLIDVKGKPMIQRVIESLGIDGHYIFCILKEHEQKYSISNLLKRMTNNNPTSFVIVDKVTEGAVCTCLLAREYIDNDNPLLVCNSDQIIEFNRPLFLGSVIYYDGAILTFPANDPKWSYVLTDSNNIIKAVREKEVISSLANTGCYGWKHGHYFVDSSEELIKRNIRTNNEFYIAETYNILLEQKKIIKSIKCDEMLGCGTPSDLEQSIKILSFKNEAKNKIF